MLRHLLAFICGSFLAAHVIAAPATKPAPAPAIKPAPSPATKPAAKPASAPSAKPATGPTTAPHRLIMPPGFVKLEVAERNILCEAADKAWCTKALTDLQPSARPTTMPSDLADMLSSKRDDLIKQMTTDLGITDTSSIQKLFAEQVIPDLEKMAEIRPPIYYLVCTREKLLDLIHKGWSDPRFHYNRVADDVSVYQNIDLSIQHSMDDVLIPALYETEADQAKRIEGLQRQIDRNEASIAGSLAQQGLIMLQSGLVVAIEEAAIKPLALQPGQEWLGIGIEGLLSTRYMSRLNGMRPQDLLEMLTRDDPRNPIRASTINLIHPTSPALLKPEYAPAYVDALRRRSVLVVNNLNMRSADCIPKILAAVKKSPPKDGEALVALIKQATSVDLSQEVLPQP